MGSRTLPHYCEHGVPVDGGDFVDSVECKDCEPTRQEKWNDSAIQKVINDAVQSEISGKQGSLSESLAAAEEELSRYRAGYQGSCYACESVGEKNVELEAKLAAAEVDAARYHELLYAVQHKHSGETRHETALRYIQQAETPNGLAKEQGHE